MATKAEKKRHYEKYREREMAKQKARYLLNRVRYLAQRKARYDTEREERQAIARAKYASDPQHAERIREHNRRRRASRLEEYRTRDRQYAKVHQNKDRERFIAKMRRATLKRRALTAGAFVEPIDSAVVFSRDKGVCGICREKVDPNSRWHVDHVIPLSQGGLHSYVNVQLAHARCNMSKQGKMPRGQIGLFQRKSA